MKPFSCTTTSVAGLLLPGTGVAQEPARAVEDWRRCHTKALSALGIEGRIFKAAILAVDPRSANPVVEFTAMPHD